jgi:TonB family protein
MVSAPNAIPNKPSPAPDRDLTFLIEPEPWLRAFLRNLADVFRPTPPRVWITARPGEYWSDALVDRPVAWAAIRKSFLGHLLGVVSIYGLTLVWVGRPQVLPETVPRNTITHYEVSEYLPAVKPAHEKTEATRPHPQKADPEYAPQEIVAIDIGHKSTLQTVVNPVKPQLLAQDTPLPNLVVWTPVPSPAPMARNHPLVFPLSAPQVVPPPPEVAKRNLNNLQVPVSQPEAVAPASRPAIRDLTALNLPVQSQAAVPPAQNAVQRNLGDVNLAFNTPAVESPQLPMPEQHAANSQQTEGSPTSAASIPDAQPITTGTGKAQGQEVGQLLALNVHPIVPNGNITLPDGNRPGEFAAGPNGHAGATARPEIKAGEKDLLPGSNTGNGGVPAGIYVGDPPKKVDGNAIVAVAPPVRPRLGNGNTASTDGPVPGKSSPGIDSHDGPAGRIENQVFGGKRYYSMSLNMPNLTSSAGSWIIRFAELNPPPGTAGINISAPVAVFKVDPAYPADLMRDRVEGVVVLYAVIHSDGSVGDVRVLEGIQNDLDHSARTAIQKWQFRPGTKNGLPVDLEAVIRVPFKAPRMSF